MFLIDIDQLKPERVKNTCEQEKTRSFILKTPS